MHPIIYKFSLDKEGSEGELLVPYNGELLSIQNQFDVIQMWLLTSTVLASNPDRLIHYQIVGTGQIFKQKYPYKATVQVRDFVWHIFSDV